MCQLYHRGRKINSLDLIAGGRVKKDIIVVDDRISYWPHDLDNLIPVNPYKGDSHDDTLPKVLKMIMKLGQLDDIRSPGLVQYFELKNRSLCFIQTLKNSAFKTH